MESNDNSETKIANKRITGEVVTQSILAMLQDKNKFISMLKEQIQNQKSQLQFYLHRGLSSPQIMSFAGNCIPVMAEENLHLNLALNQFCRKNGVKSKIMSLHERMTSVERRIVRVANSQEEMVETLRKFPRETEWLPKILESNDVLRTELEAFRTCCNRLILIEDERNCLGLFSFARPRLLEQVYSVPAPQRINYNTLLVALNEKTSLEKELAEIKKEQRGLILRLNTIKSPDQSGDSSNYFPKLARLKEVNGLLAAKVSELEQDARCKQMLENKMETLICDYQTYRDKTSKQLSELNTKLGFTLTENERLTQTLKKYQTYHAEINSLRASIAKMEVIRNERDYFKSKVEDLKSIRDTYTQLIEQPFAALRDQEMVVKDQERHIAALEKERAVYRVEIANLKMLLEESDAQIRKMMDVIKLPGQNQETCTEFSAKSYRDFGCNSEADYPEALNPAKRPPNPDEDNGPSNVQKAAIPVTSLNVQTLNSQGIVETLKAIVESTSPVDGVIQLSNSSAFTVRLTCGSQNAPAAVAGNQEIVRQSNNRIKCSTIVMDEFELMKDSSNEALVGRLPSIHNRDVEEQTSEVEEKPPSNRSFGCMFRERGVRDETCNTISSVDELDFDDLSDECNLRERFKHLVGNNIAVQMFDLFTDPCERYALE
ncbi:uncharacterized protein LOC116180462 isoform X2 [Photinus pyralis]|uniref:uncharacterized protein LOC116180462 isoform X2 n=1 Tax=Photinus pyralis TaxID=7054 RepID=UPI001267602F|nr:uncharacterized protein LOC116180462 isoform X2 [Photinus pyralis]